MIGRGINNLDRSGFRGVAEISGKGFSIPGNSVLPVEH